VDSALDSEDIEDEIEEEVDKVLTAIAGETAAQLPEAVRKERVKQPGQSVGASEVCWVIANFLYKHGSFMPHTWHQLWCSLLFAGRGYSRGCWWWGRNGRNKGPTC